MAATSAFKTGMERGISIADGAKKDFQRAGGELATQDQAIASDFFFRGVTDNIRSRINSQKNARYIPHVDTSQWDSSRNALEDTSALFLNVASAQSLTFDLEIGSTPQNADVSYKRTGESYTHWSKVTDTTIPNLAYAVWTIRAARDKDVQEKDHDPFQEKNHVVHFDFVK
jgi:hypothetical protein